MSAGDTPEQMTAEGRADRAALGRSGAVPFIGLTGGIGAGKSTALSALERLGAVTLSTDAVVHELYAGSEPLRRALTDRWGEQVAPGGTVDRSAVAARVFGDDDARHWLEQLVWPLVGERVAAFRARAEATDPQPRAAVVETPLLFEAGMEAAYDATIAVVADEEVRRKRAGARGHEAVAAREARQLSQAEKAARATFTVHNHGSERDLESQLAALLERLGR